MSDGFRQPSGSYVGPATRNLVIATLLLAVIAIGKSLIEAPWW